MTLEEQVKVLSIENANLLIKNGILQQQLGNMFIKALELEEKIEKYQHNTGNISDTELK